MKHPPVLLVLRDGWECLIELLPGEDGSFDGRAEVLCQGERRCVLMALNAGGPEELTERLTRRAHTFIDQAACPEDDGD